MSGFDETVLAMRSRPQRLPSPNCVLIVGAGWSSAAGLPLASQLFERSEDLPFPDSSDGSVIDAYDQWHREYPEGSAEQFIAHAYEGRARLMLEPICKRPGPLASGQLELDLALKDEQWIECCLSWPRVAAYLQRRLAAPAARTRSYKHIPTRPALLRRTPSPEQAVFWDALLDRTTVRAILTTNYDLTVEQTVGFKPDLIPGSPGFHYAGIEARVHRVNSPFGRDRAVDPTPTGFVPLAKLHGSLNWSLGGTGMDVFADVRPAFRGEGFAAIVPPLPEKHVPSWLVPVWDRAAMELSEADEWVVVGYSMPPYDREIKTMLEMSGRRVRRIRIYDPCAAAIADRWRSVVPNASVDLFEGLEPGFYARGGASGRLPRDEIERRRSRASQDPRALRVARQRDRHGDDRIATRRSGRFAREIR